MARSKWLLLLLVPMLFGFDTRNPIRTRGPFKAYDFTFNTNAQGGCTDGVDCYCDTAAYASDSLGLACLDFEADALYLDWYSTGGQTGNRGAGGYWTQNYGSFQGGQFKSTDPTPRVGSACTFSACSGNKSEYCSAEQGNLVDGQGADCFGPGMNTGACVDIQRGGDVFYEIPSLTLTGGFGTDASIGSGNAHFAERVPAGSTCGNTGRKTFTASTEVGVTQLLGFSSNLDATGIFATYWKGSEWASAANAGTLSEHWYTGRGNNGGASQLPFRPFMFTTGSSACQTALNSATVVLGTASCQGIALYYAAATSVYSQTRDFPWGTWKCVQAHISGLNSSNVTIKIWLEGTLIFHITGFDGSALENKNYQNVTFDSYANANANQGVPATTQTAFRYNDNIHIRNGPPVACSVVKV